MGEYPRSKDAFSKLVERAAAGEEIVISKAGKPVAKLVPAFAVQRTRVFGGMEGRIRMADDFDAPLPDDLLRLYEGGNEKVPVIRC